jgi:hypothetical protein
MSDKVIDVDCLRVNAIEVLLSVTAILVHTVFTPSHQLVD